jgi:hypothetical protein
MRIMAYTLLMTVLCFCLCGCKKAETEEKTKPQQPGTVSTEEVKKEIAEAADTSLDYATQKKKEYEEAIALELVELDKQLAELKKKANAAEEEVRSEVLEAVGELDKEREAVQKKLEEIQAKAPDAWEDLKAGLDEALDTLKDSYEKAKSRFD